MIAVTPKTDCPHVGEHVVASLAPSINVNTPCKECNGAIENWVCCKCGECGCSRHQQSHMSKHAETTEHKIAASFSDFSVWCYACDSYITHPTLAPILAALKNSKFPQTPTATAPAPAPTPATDKPAPAINTSAPSADSNKNDEKKEDKVEKDVAASLAKLSIEPEPKKPTPGPILSSLDVNGIADLIKSGKAKNIIVMTGAGVSVAAGIPDFRTPGTGLYYNLQKYNLPKPEAVFDIDYFIDHPQAFYTLAKELYPGNFVPTYCHYFIRLLHDKGLLLRNYTQNIDTLERIANIPASALVEAHGTFGTAHCVNSSCKKEFESDYVRDAVFADRIPRCDNQGCDGLVKPDIVFFGEGLPSRFFDLLIEDFPLCDLLIVIGTSLKVYPFAGLIKRVSTSVPRLLINWEEVGTASFYDQFLVANTSGGFTFNHPANVRDVKLLGECQEGVKKLADLLGWGQELEDLYQRESKIILANKPSPSTAATVTSTTTITSTPSCTTTVTTETTVTTSPSKVPFLDTAVKEPTPAPKSETTAPEPVAKSEPAPAAAPSAPAATPASESTPSAPAATASAPAAANPEKAI